MMTEDEILQEYVKEELERLEAEDRPNQIKENKYLIRLLHPTINAKEGDGTTLWKNHGPYPGESPGQALAIALTSVSINNKSLKDRIQEIWGYHVKEVEYKKFPSGRVRRTVVKHFFFDQDLNQRTLREMNFSDKEKRELMTL